MKSLDDSHDGTFWLATTVLALSLQGSHPAMPNSEKHRLGIAKQLQKGTNRKPYRKRIGTAENRNHSLDWHQVKKGAHHASAPFS